MCWLVELLVDRGDNGIERMVTPFMIALASVCNTLNVNGFDDGHPR